LRGKEKEAGVGDCECGSKKGRDDRINRIHMMGKAEGSRRQEAGSRQQEAGSRQKGAGGRNEFPLCERPGSSKMGRRRRRRGDRINKIYMIRKRN